MNNLSQITRSNALNELTRKSLLNAEMQEYVEKLLEYTDKKCVGNGETPGGEMSPLATFWRFEETLTRTEALESVFGKGWVHEKYAPSAFQHRAWHYIHSSQENIKEGTITLLIPNPHLMEMGASLGTGLIDLNESLGRDKYADIPRRASLPEMLLIVDALKGESGLANLFEGKEVATGSSFHTGYDTCNVMTVSLKEGEFSLSSNDDDSHYPCAVRVPAFSWKPQA